MLVPHGADSMLHLHYVLLHLTTMRYSKHNVVIPCSRVKGLDLEQRLKALFGGWSVGEYP